MNSLCSSSLCTSSSGYCCACGEDMSIEYTKHQYSALFDGSIYQAIDLTINTIYHAVKSKHLKDMKKMMMFSGAMLLAFFVLAQDCRFGAPVRDFIVAADSLGGLSRKDKVVNYYGSSLLLDSTLSRLRGGGEYRVRLYPVNSSLSGDDALKFLSSQDAVFLGKQGLNLLWRCRDSLPSNRWILSLDKKSCLQRRSVSPYDGTGFYAFVPAANLEADHQRKDFCVSLSRFEEIRDGTLILCVTRE